MDNRQSMWTTAALSGIIGLVIGLIATYLVALIWPTPWILGQALIAVGAASFFAAFFATYGVPQQR